MAKVRFKWNGAQFMDRLHIASREGLQQAGIFFHGRCRAALNKPNTGERRRRKRDTSRGKKGSQYTVYPSPSQPGEPPRKRTGHGQSEVKYETNQSKTNPKVRVGVTKKGLYMAFLELGTKYIEPRPWLMKTLQQYWGVIARIAATGGRRKIK